MAYHYGNKNVSAKLITTKNSGTHSSTGPGSYASALKRLPGPSGLAIDEKTIARTVAAAVQGVLSTLKNGH